MSRGGWIKLYRSIEDNFLSEDKPYDYMHAWISLLLLANSKEKDVLFNRIPYTVKRGEIVTSVRFLSEKWGWSRNKVCRFLRLLDDKNMIKIENDKIHGKGTLLTIVKYDDFQDVRDSKRTVKGQSRDSERTVKGHTRDSDVTVKGYNKEYKEYKEKEKEINKEKESAFDSPSREGSPAPEERETDYCYLFDGNGEWV